MTDVKFVIRKSKKKMSRVRYLLEMKAEIKKATTLDADAVQRDSKGNPPA